MLLFNGQTEQRRNPHWKKYMYITEDLPVNNTRRCFKKVINRTFRIAPSQWRSDEGDDEELLLPRKEVGHTGQWMGFRDGRARPPFISTLQISLRHVTSFSTLWIFCLFFVVFLFFYTDFVKTKFEYIYRSTRLDFFFLYIRIF